MPKIFISYRRQSAEGDAGRLYDHLVDRFGRTEVFVDVDAIEFGIDYVKAIEDILENVDVVLVVIDPDWLTVEDEKGRSRLQDPTDLLRLEIATALKRNIRVIPVLVRGAHVPKENELTEDLVLLARRNAIELSGSGYMADIDRLATSIEKLDQVISEDNQRKRYKIPKKDRTKPKKETKRKRRWLLLLVIAVVIVGGVYILYQSQVMRNVGQFNYAKDLVRKYHFFATGDMSYSNPRVSGFNNDFQVQSTIIYDRATGLTWQRQGSPQSISYPEIQHYLNVINEERFAGYSDWRLPTLTEAWTLLEHRQSQTSLHIDDLFGKEQKWIWTSNIIENGYGWYMHFNYGRPIFLNAVGSHAFVRAVRGPRFE